MKRLLQVALVAAVVSLQPYSLANGLTVGESSTFDLPARTQMIREMVDGRLAVGCIHTASSQFEDFPNIGVTALKGPGFSEVIVPRRNREANDLSIIVDAKAAPRGNHSLRLTLQTEANTAGECDRVRFRVSRTKLIAPFFKSLKPSRESWGPWYVESTKLWSQRYFCEYETAIPVSENEDLRIFAQAEDPNVWYHPMVQYDKREGSRTAYVYDLRFFTSKRACPSLKLRTYSVNQ